MMKKIRLGNTDKEVSALCLGSMYFGTKIPAESSFRLLDRYVEAGGDFVDTANLYACWVMVGRLDQCDAHQLAPFKLALVKTELELCVGRRLLSRV